MSNMLFVYHCEKDKFYLQCLLKVLKYDQKFNFVDFLLKKTDQITRYSEKKLQASTTTMTYSLTTSIFDLIFI